MQLLVQPLLQGLKLPAYGRPGDAGLDLASCSWYTIQPGERCMIPTGIAMAIPEGYVGLVRDRSGLAYQEGLTVIGGVIDANYRGEVKVLLLNTSKSPVNIKERDRIAQLLVLPIPTLEVFAAATLPESVRGANGFGSSGR
jgi:dUTP pyrophosphatase